MNSDREILKLSSLSNFKLNSNTNRLITSMTVYYDWVYLGTSDGEILQYRFHENNSPSSLSFNYEYSIRKPGKSRRSVTCLQAIKRWNMLLGIVD